MDVTHFRQHGFQIVRGVVSPDVVRSVGDFLKSNTHQALGQLRQAMPQAEDIPTICAKIDETFQTADFAQVDPAVRLVMSGHFPLEVRLAKELHAIPRDPRVRSLLGSVLQSDELFMHLPPTARFVLPGNRHAGVPAHQDISYNRHMSDFVTMWVPFVNIDDRMGGVVVFEGSGDAPEIPVASSGKFWINGVPTDGYARRHCTMNVGDVLLLNRFVIHESMPNTSDGIRYSTDLRFFAAPNKSDKHALNMQTWEVLEPQTATAVAA